MKEIMGVFNKLWNNKNTHALTVLGIYILVIIFFFIIYLAIIKFSPYVPQPEETIKKITVKNVQDKLLNNNYEYYYQIETINGLVTYKGTKTSKYEEGYRETSLGSTRYYIEEGLIYEIRLNELLPLVNLYTGIDYYLITLSDLFNLINQVKPTTQEQNTYEYNVVYNDQTLIIKINFKDLTEVTINIINDDYHYSLEYNKIGEIDELNLPQYVLSNQS